MKRNLFFIGMGAMALATPLFLSSCSSSDDIADNPGNTTGEAVKTSFTLSVGMPGGSSSNAKPATRMGEDITQAQTTPVFRGMDNMTLIPFSTKEAIKSSDTRTGSKNINLPNTTANTLLSGQITSTGNAHVYTDVSVPVGVSSFLFYGKAVDETAGTDASKAADMFKYGSLTKAGLSDGAPSGISFTPKQIYSTVTADTKASALATYLTTIAGSSYTDNATTPAEHKWSEVAPDAQGQGSALQTLYKNFTSLTAGSSASVQDAVQELYTSLNSLLQGNQTAVNKGIINAIIANITKDNKATVTNGTVKLSEDLSGFPANINLPDGAATVKCTNGTFAAQTSATYTTSGTQVAALSDYVYPANLWYRANTLIKTSDKVLTDKYKDGTAWDAILQNYDDAEGVVKNSTASIALKDQIQYAVGRLKMTVKVANGTLYDGNGETVTVPDDGFPVSAVLIGDQRKVDFQFAPIKTENDNKQYTIYDKELSGINATTNGSTANNTLALETPADENVNVLLELTNNTGKRFKGKDGYVPAGAKFYLLGTLTPSNGKIDGKTSTDIKQVFKQDYVTTANFTIKQNVKDASSNPNQNQGLGAAYNVIPDLRTPALSIGLSVDLTWQTGLTFNVDM
ncbi:MAG: hypothetical protein PUD58_10365 [Prevotella sp.]|uniref:hypothetical protein n=1 Tax=Prevotella sp. TaxID=59823 RepID=UPI002582B743|nr:hypothetical protein [Prevotella sp.]MDD6854687.1 hypothetical protein [Prevotella sp.]